MSDGRANRLGAVGAGLLLACTAVFAQPIVIDDFESGVARWLVNDSNKMAGKGPASLCSVVAASPGCPASGGAHAGLFTFLVAPQGWASASVQVRGADWKKADARTLSFWLKGDGSENTLQVALAAFGEDGSRWRFAIPIPLKDPEWHQVRIPLSQFQAGGYSVVDKLENVGLLEICKIKAITAVFCWIDNVQVETTTGHPVSPTSPAPTPEKPTPGTTAKKPQPGPAAPRPVTLTPNPAKPVPEPETRSPKPSPGAGPRPSVTLTPTPAPTPSKPAAEKPLPTDVTPATPGAVMRPAPAAPQTPPGPPPPRKPPPKPTEQPVQQPTVVPTTPGTPAPAPAAPAKPGAEPTQPTPTRVPPRRGEPEVKPPTPPVRRTSVDVDFSKFMGRTKLRVGGALAPGTTVLNSAAAAQAIADAAWHLIRIRTSDVVGDAGDTNRLEQLCNAIRAAHAYPLLCVDGTRSALLSGDDLAALGESLVQKLNVERQRNVLFWEIMCEPTAGAQSLSLGDVLDTYHRCARRMQTIDPHIRVGGVGLPAPFSDQLERLVRNARMDFLSFHFYGTHNNSTDDPALMTGARTAAAVDLAEQLLPASLAGLLSASRSPHAKVFITECAPNSVRTPSGDARDQRIQGMFGAAWTTVLLTRLAGTVDEVLLAGVGNASWGVLDPAGNRLPGYWASYVFNSYVPLKSRICRAVSHDPDLVAFAVRTNTAGNVVLINTSPLNRQVEVSVEGLGALDFVRGRRLDLTTPHLQFEGRPTRPSQTVWAKGYSVNVVQFIPRRAEVTATR